LASFGGGLRTNLALILTRKPLLPWRTRWPTGNLDPKTSAAVFESLYELARGQRVAALIATHNLELARHMDRVYALKDGRLEVQAQA